MFTHSQWIIRAGLKRVFRNQEELADRDLVFRVVLSGDFNATRQRGEFTSVVPVGKTIDAQTGEEIIAGSIELRLD